MSNADNRIKNKNREIPWHWQLVRFVMGLESSLAGALGRILFSIGVDGGKGKALDSKTIETVLVVRLDGVGDLVMTTGFLGALRNLYPKAQIVILVKKNLFNLVELCPYVDEVKQFETDSWRILQPVILPWRALRFARQSLASYEFDLAINPRWDTDGSFAGYLAYFSGARQRVGYSENVTVRKRHFNKGFDRLYTHVIEDKSLQHEVKRYANLIAFLGGVSEFRPPEVWLSDEDRSYADAALKPRTGSGRAFWVAFGPGAGHPRRRWPLANFVEIARWLHHSYGAQIIILGNKQEKKLGDILALQSGPFAVNLAGKTTLRQAVAILQKCDFFIGNDSGPMHMASLIGLPVIEISSHPSSGSKDNVNSPVRFGPWSDLGAIVQPEWPVAPCRDGCDAKIPHCIMQVSVEKVRDAIESLPMKYVSTQSPMPHSIDTEKNRPTPTNRQNPND